MKFTQIGGDVVCEINRYIRQYTTIKCIMDACPSCTYNLTCNIKLIDCYDEYHEPHINYVNLGIFPNLTHLNCYGNKNIGDISKLTSLTWLDCRWCNNVSGIEKLINLTYIDFCYSQLIRVEDLRCLKQLTSLTHLFCNGCYRINDECIEGLTNLTQLSCENCNKITDASIENLTNLTVLNCSGYHRSGVTDRSISKLTKLTGLSCDSCCNVTNNSIVKLKQLTQLSCAECEHITYDGISQLPQLTDFACDFESDLDYAALLPNMTKILYFYTRNSQDIIMDFENEVKGFNPSIDLLFMMVE